MNQDIIELRLIAIELLKRTRPMPVSSCKALAAEIQRLTERKEHRIIMGIEEYNVSKHLSLAAHQHDANAFYALLMATCREAGSSELDRLESVFPEIVAELRKRYNAPGGILSEDG